MRFHRIYFPSAAVVVAAIFYSIFWFYMAGEIEQDFISWSERQRKHDTEISYSDLRVSGYPFRLIITLDDPKVHAKAHPNRWRWEGEQLRGITYAYNLKRILLEFIGPQRVYNVAESNDGGVPLEFLTTIDHNSMWASLVFEGSKIGQIDTDFKGLRIETVQFGETTKSGWWQTLEDVVEVDLFEFHSRRRDVEGEGLAQDVVLFGQSITLNGAPPSGFTNEIEAAVLEVTFKNLKDLPLHEGDLGPQTRSRDKARKIDVSNAQLIWSPMRASVTGTLKLENERIEKGKLDVRLRGHQALVAALRDSGELEPEMATIAGAVLGALSALTADEDDEIHLPLKIKKGKGYLGFIPLWD